jgi:phage terminase large subunit-like protein
MPLPKWDASAGSIDLEKLRGRKCYAGLDLSSKTDITAFVLVFPPEEPGEPYIIIPFFWIPQDELQEKEERDGVPYRKWVREGYVMTTPGNIIDYRFIRKTINELRELYEIEEIGFDTWNATQFSLELDEDGHTMVPIIQGFKSLSEPMKEFEAQVLAGKLWHGGNPVLRWMVDNVVVRMDPNGNIAPDKKKSTAKIDGIAATLNAMARVIVHQDGSSVYEERGVISL